MGTDTGGSVISPSNANMLVGIRATLGRISRWGIAPVTLDHDMAGPMARTVADAAILLGGMESAAPDPNDPATGVCEPPPGRDYTAFLNADGLQGARIGIPRAFYYDAITLNGEGRSRGGLSADQAELMAEAIAALESAGAVIVDPADVPSLIAPDPDDNFAAWGLCVGGEQAKGPHGEALRRRDHAVGCEKGRIAADLGNRGTLTKALKLALGQGPEDHHAIGIAGRNRRRRIADGGSDPAATAAPLHVGVFQVRKTECGGNPRGVVAVVAVGGKAIDLAGLDAGVRRRPQNGLKCQLEFRVRRLAVLIVGGLANAGDRHPAPDRSLAHLGFIRCSYPL